MNLSQRLDQARSRRGPVREPAPYELRMARDAQVYDGRHLRTGEEMTSDQWDQLRPADREEGLPTWNPNRANALVAPDHTVDLTDPGADVIDLRARAAKPVPEDDVFEMPAWARRERIFRSDHE